MLHRSRSAPAARAGGHAAADLFSLLVLVGANLVPVLGVLGFDWSVGDILLLYWAESAVIGFWNIARMLRIDPVGGVPLGLFFSVHYGMFMFVHLTFIRALFLQPAGSDAEAASALQDFLHLWPALLALFVSHGLSFVRNFIGRREYLTRPLQKQMMAPYGRIVVMQLTIIFGGGISMSLDDPTPALLLMIGLKVVADVLAHRREHRRAAEAQPDTRAHDIRTLETDPS